MTPILSDYVRTPDTFSIFNAIPVFICKIISSEQCRKKCNEVRCKYFHDEASFLLDPSVLIIFVLMLLTANFQIFS